MEQENNNPPANKLSWSAYEFEDKNRHPDWLWTAGLVFGLSSIVSFFYGNIFFGIFLIIAGVVIIIYAVRKPKLLSIELVEKGISVNGELIQYENITNFWLDETSKPDKLLLRVKGSFVPTISLPLEGVKADAVRNALKPHAPEEELRESRSVALFDRIGF